MSFAFQQGHPTLDGPDDVDKLLQGIRCFRRQLGCELNPAFRKPKALRIVRAMEGAQGQAVPKVRGVFKALPADRACNATMSERRA